MTHPLERLGPGALRRLFVAGAAASLIFLVYLGLAGRPLEHPGAPRGVLSYEFSWDMAGVDRVLGGWGPPERALAERHIGVDFIFLLIYGPSVAAGALLSRDPSAARRRGFAWAALGAAGLDALENALALWLLTGARSESVAALMSGAAALKFALIGAAIAYAAAGLRASGRPPA